MAAHQLLPPAAPAAGTTGRAAPPPAASCSGRLSTGGSLRRAGGAGTRRHRAHARVGAAPVLAAETATKKKPGKKTNKANIALPGPYQQTLKRSFTVGGLGLHSGEYAYVRVRPALAGEGRYFVRVPDGTNARRFAMEETLSLDMEDVGEADALLDRDEEAFKVQLFGEYLAAQEAGDFDGSFIAYLTEQRGLRAAVQTDTVPEDEAVQARGADEPHVPAAVANLVQGLPHFQGLQAGELRVGGAEHLLSALEASGVDNARIEIEGGAEVPIIDGSALGWCVAVAQAGVRNASYGDRDKIRKVAFAPAVAITVQEGDAFVQILPGDLQRVTVGIDFHGTAEVVGKQWWTWCPQEDEGSYRWSVAPARTFAPSVEWLMELRQQGLLRGGTSDCAVTAHGDRWYDPSMVRFPNDEPVRHRCIDIVGDLSLLARGGCAGLPMGHVVAYQADHALLARFLEQLDAAYDDNLLRPVG